MLSKILSVAALSAVLFSAQVSAMSATPESGYTATKYPIVLTHGLYGFDSLLGVDYWYKVPETLQKDGARVFVTTVSNSNSPEIRGEQLIPQIEQILAITGAEKVNLIGHSHGGPTTRYVASVRPDLIASVTTIAGVNRGTPVAETLNDWANGSTAFEGLISALGNALAETINFLSGGDYDQDILMSMRSMTFAETAAFNQQHPGGIPTTACGEGDYQYNGVRYYSWSGAKPLTNVLDPLDLLTGTTSLFFPAGEKNDGLVGSCSSRLGMVIRDDFRMNHLDEVNQTLGLHDLTETDPLTVFRTHANRLKNIGL
ncbi:MULTISPECIES: lipase family alpha/beta hydrolase [Thalassolituus]|jgi:triacylglycerol lipase|uniref:lipase family alpha/beta hydrolase n=1 Tax=Thalassolituus TaxID=187492 RepID=UPI000C369CEB|nr:MULTISPECIES: triacylglycerol lipase [Thalassolituus]MAY14153.1 lipase [Oceanospirillaceae bacterium]PIQ41821.1 MAG: lipase [Thalassolituus sp. CG17_big_fil_post_rev_8_21_14_2_50_53_8]MCA6061214.1 triacylglycerol lipase [Thalassolituus sp. ST750PaO-4]MCB2388118.1 triacylglycerol lipase [Thalassolituus alkanivorans]MCB2424657.1 triacylglycerol lipase [Thalassolituus alkanivorans]